MRVYAKYRKFFFIHRSQGSGYPKILLSFGAEERFANDSYTVVSRVSRLSMIFMPYA